MRRQARISAGGACIVRSASALQVWLWLLIFIFQNEFRISRSIQPGYLDFDNLPETNFTCAGKVIGGYYADLETSCQMFHVCTVGQQDEPMDIKFLCLNGTVFDQETRVCERVDEVDCTKSEKFYSLNLELYGSTTPPIIQPEETKPQTQPTEQTRQQTKPSQVQQDHSVDEASTITQDKTEVHIQEAADSTEDPIQDIKKDVPKIPQINIPAHIHFSSSDNDEFTEEYHEDDDTEGEYEDYPHVPTTTQTPVSIKTTITTTTTTSRPRPSTTIIISSTSSRHQTSVPQQISSPSPILSSLSPPLPSPLRPSTPTVASGLSAPSAPSLDPTLLSPQEFVFRHRPPVSETIPYQTFRPADGVYITHAPPDQFDHFPYESSRTEPRPTISRPFAQRPQPAPFRTTTNDPRNQILRPGPTSLPSERHETSVKHRQQNYPSALPEQRPLPFNPYYYDRKRSEDSVPENESSLSARSVAPPSVRSVAPPSVTERPPIKFKSPPRVIVTASASVSDSTGKRLNYTVGNVVSAVKPIVPINYDDYKESDLIFDPFFLDVPKLQKRRKTRSNHNSRVFTIPVTPSISSDLISDLTTIAAPPGTSQATTTESSLTTVSTTTSTATWNLNDYVDDNYEPQAYVPPIPPLALLVPQNLNGYNKKERQSINDLVDSKTYRDKAKVGLAEHSKPTPMSTAQTNSSQRMSVVPERPVVSPPPPPPFEVSACANSRSTDCRTRA